MPLLPSWHIFAQPRNFAQTGEPGDTGSAQRVVFALPGLPASGIVYMPPEGGLSDADPIVLPASRFAVNGNRCRGGALHILIPPEVPPGNDTRAFSNILRSFITGVAPPAQATDFLVATLTTENDGGLVQCVFNESNGETFAISRFLVGVSRRPITYQELFGSTTFKARESYMLAELSSPTLGESTYLLRSQTSFNSGGSDRTSATNNLPVTPATNSRAPSAGDAHIGSTTRSDSKGIIAAACGGGLGLLVVAAGVFYWRRRDEHSRSVHSFSQNKDRIADDLGEV
jgi:hypothetical protein